MTIQKAIDAYLLHCKLEKNLNSKTIQAYTIDLKQFHFFTEMSEIECVQNVDRVILRNYFNKIENLKPRSIKRKMTCLKTMFNYLEFEDVIDINPFRKMQLKYKVPKYLPTVMDKREIEKLLKTAYTLRSAVQNKSTYSYAEKTRDIAILETLFATGVRVSELCHLQKKDIDLDSGLITIFGKGNKERIVQIVDSETKSILDEYATLFQSKLERSDFFFINRLNNCISSQSVRYMVHKYVQLADIKKKVTPHTFRHTFATLLLEADVDLTYIQHFLGHSSIMTTQIYTHVNKQKQQQILRTKHPRMDFRMLVDG